MVAAQGRAVREISLLVFEKIDASDAQGHGDGTPLR